MATASDIVTAALREIGVVADDEAASAAQMDNGVDQLNRMMHGWKADGVDVTHSDYTSASTFALADEYQDSTVILLAKRLCGEYSLPVSADLRLAAKDAWTSIWGNLSSVSDMVVDTGIQRMPSSYLGSLKF